MTEHRSRVRRRFYTCEGCGIGQHVAGAEGETVEDHCTICDETHEMEFHAERVHSIDPEYVTDDDEVVGGFDPDNIPASDFM